jgi:hypothetical protein
MSNLAKTRQEYRDAWAAHVRELRTLSFQAHANRKEEETVFNTLSRWIDRSANRIPIIEVISGEESCPTKKS